MFTILEFFDVAHAPSVCQHGEKSVLANVVVTFAQTFRAILVGGTKTIVGIVAPSAALCVCEVHIHRTFNEDTNNKQLNFSSHYF